MSVFSIDPSAAGDFMFGDAQLHSRFFCAIELLAQIVTSTPRPLSSVALSETVGKPARMVRALLQCLHKSALVRQDEKNKDMWHCAPSLEGITLADIFRSISVAGLGSTALRKKKSGISIGGAASRNTTQQSVDLLLMQATMDINQVVLQHLQQFDLGRLRALGSGVGLFGTRPGPYRASHPPKRTIGRVQRAFLG